MILEKHSMLELRVLKTPWKDSKLVKNGFYSIPKRGLDKFGLKNLNSWPIIFKQSYLTKYTGVF